MEQKNELTDWEFFKKKAKEHWKILTAAIAAGVCALIGVVLVLIWFVQTSDIGIQGTATFNQWSVGWIWGFVLMLLVWGIYQLYPPKFSSTDCPMLFLA